MYDRHCSCSYYIPYLCVYIYSRIRISSYTAQKHKMKIQFNIPPTLLNNINSKNLTKRCTRQEL